MQARRERCCQCGRTLMVPLEVNSFNIMCNRCRGIPPGQPNYPPNQAYGPFPPAGNRPRDFINNMPPGQPNYPPNQAYGPFPPAGNRPRDFINNPGYGRPEYGGYYYPQYRPVRAPPPPPPLMPPAAYGKKRAVLCGISYGKRSNRLKGSLNDAQCMKYFLIDKLGFPNDSIRMLTDDPEEKNPMRIPTKYNMRVAMRWLVEGCQPGDSLVFYFSGHGSKEVDLNMDELDGYDEALCPVDYEHEGKIIDDEINSTIVRPLPRGAKLHALVDSCFSGTILDLPFMCRMNRQGYYGWEDHRHPRAGYKGTSGGLAVCISACDDDGSTADTTALSGMESAGALTYSFIQAMQDEPKSTYGKLLNAMRSAIRGAKEETFGSNGQHFSMNIRQQLAHEPQLTSSEKFELYSKPVAI